MPFLCSQMSRTATRSPLVSRCGWAIASRASIGLTRSILEEYQHNGAYFLPIPATFVVAADRRVVARFVDPDFRKRMEIDDIIAALKRAWI